MNHSKLILVRHGESVWNRDNRFTGWVDVFLSEKGKREARNAGRKLKRFMEKEKFEIHKTFVSHLMRAVQTLMIMLEVMKINKVPIIYHDKRMWKNIEKMERHSGERGGVEKNEFKIFMSPAIAERFYGNLQGLNKDFARKKFGKETVHLWRRSYDIAPPGGHSLKDTIKRTKPFFRKEILPLLKKGKNILVVAHGNSLRAVVMDLEKLKPDEIIKVEIPTGVPIVYNISREGKILTKKIL